MSSSYDFDVFPPWPPSPPVYPPGYSRYGPTLLNDIVFWLSIVIAVAVTLCAAYVVIHFAALSAQPDSAPLRNSDEAGSELPTQEKELDMVVE